MKKKKIDERTKYMLIGVAIGILGGILLGMVLQQMILTAQMVEFGESLEGTTFNIEVDLNETVLVDRFTEAFIPIFNQTIQENNMEEIK